MNNFNLMFFIFFSLYFLFSVTTFFTGVANAKVEYCTGGKYNRISTYSGHKYIHKLGCYLGEDV